MQFYENRRARWAWAAICGTARPCPPGLSASTERCCECASVSDCFGSWDSAYANPDRWWRKPIPNDSKRIKKTPSADDRSRCRSVGNRRGALPATWFALPDVDSTGDQGSDFAACAHAPQRGLLWRRAPARRAILFPTRDPQVQRAHLLGLPACAVPYQRRQPAAGGGDHGQCPLPPRPTPPRLARATCQPLRPGLLAAVQPGAQPHRTGLETHTPTVLTQPLLPDPRRSHQLCRESICKLESGQHHPAPIMRNYLRRCVYMTEWIPGP